MKTIGIIGAMPTELAGIQSLQEQAVKETIDGFEFVSSEHGGKRIVTACCGIGKVNAALCAQVMIDHFGVEEILNTGIAGGMKQGIRTLEIVIATSVLPHDILARFLEQYPPYCSEYKTDERLQALAEQVCKEKGIVCHKGRIVSGDSFITEGEVRDALVANHDPYAVDMESAAIGQCCFRCGVPFVSVRCISDLADEMATDDFEALAAKKVAEIVMAMVEQ